MHIFSLARVKEVNLGTALHHSATTKPFALTAEKILEETLMYTQFRKETTTV